MKKKKFPELLNDDCCIIKLSKFNNLPVAVIFDQDNGGIAISYEDKHLDEVTKMQVEKEIQEIISTELDKIMKG